MTSTREERVDNALQQLLERLVPQYPDEDEALADQRWDEANEFAHNLLDAEPDASVLEDVNHAADLIKAKFVREEGGPEKATVFGNLYSRLLSQPVLGQKWAILWFLMRVGEGESGGSQRQRHGLGGANGSGSVAEEEDLPSARNSMAHDVQRETKATQRRSFNVDSPAFNEAFSRNGLQRIPSAEGRNSDRPPPVRDRGQAGRPRPQQATEEVVEGVLPKNDGKMHPPESALLRDLPFTLQGLSSTNLAFSDSKTSLKLPPTLPIPIISLLHTLAEPSLLYSSLSAFVDSTSGGLIAQSLRSAIGLELRSYLGLVATLEGQIRRALAQLDESLPNGGLGKAGVTLKRRVLWTRDATLGLRLMSLVVDSSKDKKGGELISLIHNFAVSHGDLFVHTFAERLLASITRPFYSMLRAWIFSGELEDPYLEFFVSENHDYEDSAGAAASVWEQKYSLQPAMLPSILAADFANRVFLIGKSLNFIRYSCADGAWVETYSKSTSRELQYGDTATLSSSIDSAYATVMARLIHLMETKFALHSHLLALKKYLLLGQGDFIALLMESLANNLDRPANSQYRHTLTAQLEHAIRNSNAQYDSPDVLRRLDARMLELSHGEIGWDVFTLEYRVDSPLDVIVTPWASKQYLKVFNFLWRVKRVEFALSTTWRRVQTGARGVLAAVSDTLGVEWKSARGGLARMVHFVDQLQYYILFEVIEAGWQVLQKALRTPDATLDTLVEAHTTYLKSITRKGLLGSGGVGGGVEFTGQLHELLKLMLGYREVVDGLYSFSVAEFTRRQERKARIETRTKAGAWGTIDGDDDGVSTKKGRTRERDGALDSPLPPLLPLLGSDTDGGDKGILQQLRQRLKSLEADFITRVNVLLGDLAYQPDVDMRFLGVVMNFNEVYQPVRRRRQRPADKDKEK